MLRMFLAGVGLAFGSIAVVSCAGLSPKSPLELSVTTEDGFTIYSTYRMGFSAGAPVVVLLHDLKSDRSVWNSVAEDLADRGLASLTIDLRGFGQSTEQAASPSELSGQHRENLYLDLTTTLDVARERFGLDERGVLLVGAGLSVNAAARAIEDRSYVRGLVLISGLIEESEELQLIERSDLPLLMLTSAEDRRGTSLMAQYATRLTGPNQIHIALDGPRWRGLEALTTESGLHENIVFFAERTFGLAIKGDAR